MSSSRSESARPNASWMTLMVAAAAPTSIFWFALADVIMSGYPAGLSAGHMMAVHAPLLVGCVPLAVGADLLPRRSWLRRAAIALWATVAVAYCLWPMRNEPTVTDHASFWLAACGACVTIAGLSYWSGAVAGLRAGLKRWLPALSFIGLAFALVAANNAVLPCQYLGFHQSLLRLALLGFVAWSVLSGVFIASSPLRWMRAAQAVVGLVLLVAGFFWQSAANHSDFYIDSAVGRALVPAVVGDGQGRGGNKGAFAIADAVATFGKHNGYPKIDIKLADYNILIVMVEATRARETTLVEPETRARVTPNLTRFIKTAIAFPKAYAPSSTTFQSMASFFSMVPPAMSPIDVWAKVWQGRLRDERPWAPQIFRRSGWDTIWIGHDFNQVFSAGKIRGMQRGFDTVTLRGGDRALRRRAVDALAKRATSNKRFLMLAFFAAPHASYKTHYRQMPGRSERERYRHEVRFADEQFGRILDVLDTTNLAANTIVIFTSDHGEAFGEHGRDDHGSDVHVEQVHVPLVVRIPGIAPRRIGNPVALYSLLPWLMLEGPKSMSRPVTRLVEEDLGPLYQATRGAAVSDLVDHHFMLSVLRLGDRTLVLDLGLERIGLYRDERETRRLVPQPSDIALARRYLRFRALWARYRRFPKTTAKTVDR